MEEVFKNRYFTKRVTFKAAPSGSGSGGGVASTFIADSGRATPISTVLKVLSKPNFPRSLIHTRGQGNVVYVRLEGWSTLDSGDAVRIHTFVADDGSSVGTNKDSFNFYGGVGVTTSEDYLYRADLPNDRTVVVSSSPRVKVVTNTTLIKPSTDPKDSFNLIYLSNAPIDGGMQIQLPAVGVGHKMSFVSINGYYEGFRIYPPASGKIWGRTPDVTSVGNPDGTIGAAMVNCEDRGNVLELVCTVENREWKAINMIGEFFFT